jgi:phosphoglycerate dehydrogenase-like enzyme
MTTVAITPRSMRDSPGKHHELLEESGLELRWSDRERLLTEAEMLDLVRGCTGLIVGLDPVSRDVLEAGPVRVVVKYGSGTDNIDLGATKDLGVEVESTPGANARSVAELTVALIFSLARYVCLHDRRIRAGSWSRRMGTELEGKRLGVIGLGAVGHEVARMASGLGMEVVAHDPFLERAEVQLIELEDLLSGCDVVTLHAPLEDSTRNLIDSRNLSLMRPGALLVNTARGGLVDESALAEALSSGRLAGAALDAFHKEPPESSPLLELENFVASPHAGASTVEATRRMGAEAVRKLLRLLDKAGMR